MPVESGTAIKAVKLAFDMDGTLIDSTGLIEKAWVQWANCHGLAVAPVLQACHGRRATETIALFSDAAMNIEVEATRVAEFVDARLDELKPTPGAMRLIRSLPPDDWGLVTSAERRIADRWMRHLGFPVPNVVIAAEDVAEGKPSPEPYIAAALALGCRPDEMVVFEDSVAGLTSAQRSGAHVIAVGAHSQGYALWVPDFLAYILQRACSGGVTKRPTGRPGRVKSATNHKFGGSGLLSRHRYRHRLHSITCRCVLQNERGAAANTEVAGWRPSV